MKTGFEKQIEDNKILSTLHKCANYILYVSKKDINLANYDLLELVEELIDDNV